MRTVETTDLSEGDIVANDEGTSFEIVHLVDFGPYKIVKLAELTEEPGETIDRPAQAFPNEHKWLLEMTASEFEKHLASIGLG